MSSDRRGFLGALAAGLGALALPGTLAGCARLPEEAGADASSGSTGGRRLDAIGVQLYTLRSLLAKDFEGTLDPALYKKVLFDGLENEQVKHLKKPTYINLMKTAVDNSDGAIIAGDNIPEELKKYLSKQTIPVLEFKNREEFGPAYQEFYSRKILS